MSLGKQSLRSFEVNVPNPQKKSQTNYKYGVLVSRLPKDFDFEFYPDDIVFIPTFKGRNGGFCFVFTPTEPDLQVLKTSLQAYRDIKIKDFRSVDDNNKKEIVQAFKDMEKLFKKKIFLKLRDVKKQLKHQAEIPSDILSSLEEITNEVKEFCENYLIQYRTELTSVFDRFLNHEEIKEDLSQNDFAFQLFLALAFFCIRKIKPETICAKMYFFSDIDICFSLNNFESLTKDKKVYMLDILYQAVFFKSPFKNPQSIIKSIFSKRVVDESISLSSDLKDLAEKIRKILHLIGLKYFNSLINYSSGVESFINSVQIVKLPDSLIGLTLMNSTVLIKNKCLSEYDGFSINNRFVTCDAFITLTSVHEFGHYIQRVNLKKKFEWFAFGTPIDFLQKGSPQPLNQINPAPKDQQDPLPNNPKCQLSRKSANLKNPESSSLHSTGNKASQNVSDGPIPKKPKNRSSSVPKISISSPKQSLSPKLKKSSSPVSIKISKSTKLKKLSSPESKNSKISESEKSKRSSSKEIKANIPNQTIEGGLMLITAIFGKEISVLNYYDSVFLADPNNWELSEIEFREKYEKEACKANPPQYKKFFPVRCSHNQSIFPVYFGICLSSRR